MILTTKNLIAKETPYSFSLTYKRVFEYLETKPNFTIAGALRAAKISYLTYQRMINKPESVAEQKIVKLFDELKLILAEFLETELIYQTRKFYNHNQASWMLKKLHPDMYADKVISKEISVNGNKTTYTFEDDLKNESGFSLLESKTS